MQCKNKGQNHGQNKTKHGETPKSETIMRVTVLKQGSSECNHGHVTVQALMILFFLILSLYLLGNPCLQLFELCYLTMFSELCKVIS